MKLTDWAKKQGITYKTAWNWFKTGKMPVPAIKTPTGMILVQERPEPSETTDAWIYARVSTYAKKADLDRQAVRIEEFCRARGWCVRQVVKEVASGMNDNRRKLRKLLESRPSRIVVEHKDRLTRFGFGYFEILLKQLGCDLVVVNRDTEEKNDLMKDMVSIITSFCCRLYGLRRGRSKAGKLKKELL
jgi:predicted site-specific integrase-resolvase